MPRNAPRYRKLFVSFWSNARVAPLSTEAKYLMLYLLLGPHTTLLPGLWPLGRLQLAEAIDWSPEQLDAVVAELSKAGELATDWSARVVWVPLCWEMDPPASPDVIRGWKAHIPNVPDCQLKWTAIEQLALRAYAAGFSEGMEEVLAHFDLEPPAGPPSPSFP